MATIDGYYITVESEQPAYDVDITEQPVESGVNTSDHVQAKAAAMSISGYVTGDDAARIKEYLISAQNAGRIVEYDGRNYFSGLLKGLSTTHDYKTANGFAFSASLVAVRIAKASYVESLPPPIRAQAAPVISSGRKQVKSKAAGTKKEEVKKVEFKAGSPWAGA